MKIVETLKGLFDKIFSLPISELTFMEFLVSAALAALFIIIVVKLTKFIGKGIKKIAKVIRASLSANEKCKHIQCNTCGRTLDRCVCEKNRKRSKLGRLLLYKKEKKSRR